MSAIDITTGQTIIYESSNSKDDQNFAFDDVTRFVSTHLPKEVLYYGTFSVNKMTNNFVYNKKHEDPKYQTKFLEKVFGTTLFSSISETLGISRYTVAITSFISLLQYCLDHNPVLLESLTPPIIFSNNNNLVLSNNTIEQLDLVTSSNFKFANIFNLVNFTSTPMGYRLLKNRLVNPITNVEELNRRYDLITTFWDKYEPIQEILKTICDLEKAIRKISEKNIKNIVYSIYQIAKLVRLVEEDGLFENIKLNKLTTWLNENVDGESDILFKSERLQELQTTQQKCLTYFSKCKKTFEEAVNGSVEMLLTEEGCRFKFSNGKYKKVEKDLVILSSNKTYKYCTTKKLQAVSEEYSTACEEYETEFTKINKEFCESIKGFQKTIMSAIHFTAQLDVVVSSIICAQKFRYCRPKVMEGRSCISSKQIRHPIIEQINNTIYTPHDIDFDHNSQTGMLLYGFNASGKSSLMKAIGVNLVMAQAGLFVAAKKFKYSPYTNIQTRILSNDDLQKGMSSFAVEMSELRGILSRANDSSLILGDEISRGTESISGVAIVAAAILELVKKGSHFLFATHLHQLAELKEIKKLDRLGIFHLQVERDLKTGVLVYKRDLEPGCGDSLYGLEVARAMKLPQEFLDRAMSIRKEILNEKEFLGKSSKYNAEMFLTTCGVCGEEATEVHHIRPQKEADSDGYIEHFHKNKLRNMVGLCTACHKKVTFGKIIIKKWVETSEGMVLKWKNV